MNKKWLVEWWDTTAQVWRHQVTLGTYREARTFTDDKPGKWRVSSNTKQEIAKLLYTLRHDEPCPQDHVPSPIEDKLAEALARQRAP